MSQFLSVVGFELRVRFSRPPVYLFAALFFLLAFGLVTTDVVMVSGGVGNVARNSPFSLLTAMALLGMFASLVTVAFVATAIQRDDELRVQGLFFTTSLTKAAYLFGRFVGSMLATLVVLGAIAFGLWVGSLMPWIEPEQLVDSDPRVYLYGLAVVMLPAALVTGSLFFAVATLTRRILYAYVSFLGLTVLYFTTQAFLGDLDNELWVGLADPFGLAPLGLSMRYWTAAERNSQLPTLAGVWLANRATWLAFAAMVLAGTVARYRLRLPEESEGRRLRRSGSAGEVVGHAAAGPLPTVARDFSARGVFAQWVTQTRIETRNLVTSLAFVVICLFAVANVALTAYAVTDTLGGTSVLPVTALMLQAVQGGMGLFVVIVVVFYAGALVHKERELRLDQLQDALPVANLVFLASKLAALAIASAALLALAIATAMSVQLVLGYTRFELGLYLRGAYLLAFPGFVLMAVMAVVAQVIANHKYFGFMLVVLVIVANIALPALDFEHHLYTYGEAPEIPYSDMNGYGHFVPAVAWFTAYWGCAAFVLLVIAELAWVRGTDLGLRSRVRRARMRFDGRRKLALACGVGAQLGLGAYIFYNTNLINEYLPSDARERLSARYERLYKQYEDLPHPRIESVELDVDIFPRTRRVDVRGTMVLRNHHELALDELHVLYDDRVELRTLTIPGATLREEDEQLGYRIYDLDPPLAAAAALEVRFELAREWRGFEVSGGDTDIVANGSFFTNVGYVPHFGYAAEFELQDPTKRKEQGLPERPRMAEIDDLGARANNYISHEADWIDFEATVSTDEGQIALAPGTLRREWSADGRHYFHYEMEVPILYFFAFLSADYAVARDRWRPGSDEEVMIEIFHHPTHAANVPRMIEAIQASLDYYTANFGPYQHRQVRILEFPGYQSYAQSFPNTIPYSESIGFIADARGEDIDYVYYVTAHEVAHQWWAHQVIGGDVQGSTMLSETLAQYSALMVMEREYGRAHMQRFLRYELDRYLQGRGVERDEERPLMLVEDQQYVHYNKGSLVMYALREYLGEEALNRAIASYLAQVAYQKPPWTTSRELVEHIRAVTPEELRYLVDDGFERITLYDNRIRSAVARPLEDGRWEVTVEVSARKVYAEGKGTERESDVSQDLVEIGVFAEDSSQEEGAVASGEGAARAGAPRDEEGVLYLEKHRLGATAATLTLVVSGRPARAGIDPRHLLIDRNPGDNSRAVDLDAP